MAHALMEKEFESMILKKKPPRPPPPYAAGGDKQLSSSYDSSSIVSMFNKPTHRPPSLDNSTYWRDRTGSAIAESNNNVRPERERAKSTNNFLFIKEDLEKCIQLRGPEVPIKSSFGSSVKPNTATPQQQSTRSTTPDQKQTRKVSNPKKPPSPKPWAKSPVSSKSSLPIKPTSPTKPVPGSSSSIVPLVPSSSKPASVPAAVPSSSKAPLAGPSSSKTPLVPSSSKAAATKLTSITPTPAPRSKSPLPPPKPTSPPPSTKPPLTNKFTTKQHPLLPVETHSAPVTPPAERKPLMKKQPIIGSASISYLGRGSNTVVKGPGGSYTRAIQSSKSASILDVPAVKVNLTQKGKYFPRPAPPNPLHRSQASLTDIDRIYDVPHSNNSTTTSEPFTIEPYAIMQQDSNQESLNSTGEDDDNVYVEMQVTNTSTPHYDRPCKQSTTSRNSDHINIYANEDLGFDSQIQSAYTPLTFSGDCKSSESNNNEYTGLTCSRNTASDGDNLYSVPSSNIIRTHTVKDSSESGGHYVSLSPTRIEDNVYQDLNSSTRVSNVRQS